MKYLRLGNAAGEAGFSFQEIGRQMGQDLSFKVFFARIEPGEQIPAHIHPRGCETLIYIASGRVEHRFGERLEQRIVNEAGDFICVPAEVPHQPVNLSDTEPVLAVISCNYDQNDRRNAVLYCPPSG